MAIKMIERAQIHRFRDYVAISLGTSGETIYLDGATAREIAAQLNACSGDIALRSFPDSEFQPWRLNDLRTPPSA